MAHLEDVAVFVAVVEQGSFAAAAGHLRLPPSTVSRRVRQLEDRLGTRLLNRTTRSLALTEAGVTYFQSSRTGLGLIAAADQNARGMQAEPSGTIRISAPVDFAAALFSNIIADFLGSNPKVKIELQLTDERLDLNRARIDVAVRTGELRDSSLVAKKLGEGHRHWYASPAYLAARGTPLHPRDLKDHDCIIRGDTTEGVSWTFANDNDLESVPVTGRVCANVMSFCLLAAVNGLGIAQLPEVLARPEIVAGRLVPVLDAYVVDRGGVYLVFPSNRHLSAAVRAFVAYVETWARRPPI